MDGTLLSVDALTKAYPGVVANDSVTLALNRAKYMLCLGKMVRGNRRWSK